MLTQFLSNILHFIYLGILWYNVKKTAEIDDFTRHHGVITGNHDVRL